MKSKILSILCLVLMAALLASCGAKTASESSPIPSAATTQAGSVESADQRPENDGSVRALVTAVDGGTITVQTMGPGAGQPNGPPPQGAEKPTSSEQPETSAVASPEGTDNKSSVSGGQTSDQVGGADNQPGIGQGEELKITITDDISIILEADGQPTEGTAEDIIVGSMIGITYGEDGETVSGITVYQKSDTPPQQPAQTQQPQQSQQSN